MRGLLSAAVICVACFALTETPTAAQVPPDATARVDEIFEQWNSADSPGCAVGVAVSGQTVLSRAYGMADLEHDIPNTPATIFEGGSVSKQFTAAAVVLLALDGRLSLDDDVRQYVPEVYDYGTTITLRHMLTHTSGLRDWGSVAEISGWGRQTRTHTHAHVVDILSRQSELNFPPGHEYSYSNSGYNLLAVIVSRVSGMSFAEFSKRRIFEPLGLTNTQWRDDYTRIVKGRSTAYAVNGDDVSIMRPIENVHGNGGILTTVRDLLIWNEALEDGRLGGAEFVRLMHDRGQLNDGRRIAYAGGLFVQPFMGVPSVTHTGSTSGYRAFLGRYPDQELSVAMLCNASNTPTRGTGERVARVFLGDAVQNPVAPEAVAVSRRVLSRLVGLYANTQNGDPMSLTLEDGTLLVDGRAPLVPLSETEFQLGYSDIRLFAQQAGAGRVNLSLRTPNGDGTLVPVEEFQPSQAELAEYAGSYYSYDAETALTVLEREEGLLIVRRPGMAFGLSPVYSDAFESPGLGFVRFERDETDSVVALHLSIPRVFDMRFERVGGVVSQTQLPDIQVTPVEEHLTKLWVNDYVYVLLLECGEHTVLIDAGFEETAEQLSSKLGELGVDQIDYVINTHSNGDHTGGNELLGEGSTIISHTRCRDELAATDGFPVAGLPTTTFTDSMRLACGSGEIELIAMPGGHTDNDVVVYLPRWKILFLGDIIVSETFPVIWLDQYGDEVGVEKLIEILGKIIDNYDDDTRFLSSHGRDYSKDDLTEYRDMVVETTEMVRNAIADGKTFEQMKSENLLGSWISWNSKLWEWINTDTWIETIYRSLNR